MTRIYDCIVIGAGIAGLMASKELDKNNVDYLCIDKKKRLGEPLKCGEGVCQKTFDRYFMKRKLSFIRKKINKSRFIIFTGKKKNERVVTSHYYQVDRPEMERFMGKGLNINLNTTLKDLDKIGGLWNIKTNKEIYKARSVILAYGCNFFVQKKYNMLDKMPKLGVLFLGIYKSSNIPEDEFLFSYDDNILGGFWAFPKGNGILNAGFGAFQNTKANLKETFYKFASRIDGLEDIKPVIETGSIEPISGPIKRAYIDGLVAVGDAAGHVYAFSGEGIKYALIGGNIAGKIISNAVNKDDFSSKFLSSYEKECRKEFYSELKAGLILKHVAEWVYKKHPGYTEKMFMVPTDKDLDMVKNGRIPLKLKILYKFIKNKKYSFLES